MFDGVPKIDYIHKDFSLKRCMSKNISLDNLARRQNVVEVVFYSFTFGVVYPNICSELFFRVV